MATTIEIDDEGLTYNDDFDLAYDLNVLVENRICLPTAQPKAPNDDSNLATATIYTTKGTRVPVSQIEHYINRGPELRNYSLYEYAALVSVVKKKQQSAPDNHQATTAVALDNTSSSTKMITRTTNLTFPFDERHKLYETHVQRVRSLQKIPISIFHPPATPPTLGRDEDGIEEYPTDVWLKKAAGFAEYYLILIRPWLADSGRFPGDLSYESFCSYVEELECGDEGKTQSTSRT